MRVPLRVLRRRLRLKLLARKLAAVALGAAVTWSCPYWPAAFRPVCSVLIEIAGVFHVP